MKKTIALVLSMIMLFCLSAESVLASAAPKFYIPRKITAAYNLDPGVGEEQRFNYELSYNASEKRLILKTDNAEDSKAWLPSGLKEFLINESTDSIVNRYINYRFLDNNLEPFSDYQQFFTSDLIRYGKIREIVCKEGNKVISKFDFKVQNNKVISCHYQLPDRVINDKYEYNPDGNIKKIIFFANDPEQTVMEFKYDTQNRLVKTLIRGDEFTCYNNFSSSGIPQTRMTPDGYSFITQYYYLDSNDQVTRIYTADGTGDGKTAIGSDINIFYDSQGHMTRFTSKLPYSGDYSYAEYSDFIAI